MQSLKEYWQRISGKTRKMLIAIVAGTAVIAIIGILALNFGTETNYSTLFTGLNGEEAQEVVALLQDNGVSYRYNDKNGEIRVSAADVDQTRASLLSQGYPKSGFTYDMYRSNTGLMTTESDKKQYTLYELQDRLGAQIRLFDGIQDAKVTIAEGSEQKYALSDTTQTEASASVVVTMKNGRSLSNSEASAIKNLIARAVRGMTFTNVAVFDAETMLEVGGNGDSGDFAVASNLAALTSQVENELAANARRVLEKIYGQGTVVVSVKGSLNMEKLIQESTLYSTPEKTGEDDKIGLLQQEEVAGEYSGSASQQAGGVAGADANAETPRYTNQAADGADGADAYSNNSAAREWLYNTVKEQRQVEPGVLENATIGIVIDTADLTIPVSELVELVANSTGIDLEEAAQKITILRAESPDRISAEAAAEVSNTTTVQAVGAPIPLPLIIAVAAGAVLLLLILGLVLAQGRKKKQRLLDDIELNVEAEEEDDFPVVPQTEAGLAVQKMDENLQQSENLLNLRMQHSLKLKQNIGDFVDQNPQIAAKLLQTWLRGGE